MNYNNLYNHPRGTICVLRETEGFLVPLAIPQGEYAEWEGCFSIL